MKPTLSDKTESRIKQFVLHKDNLVLQSSSKVRSTRLHVQCNRRYMMSGCDWSIVSILQRSRLNHSLQSVHIVINLHRFVGKKKVLKQLWMTWAGRQPSSPSIISSYFHLLPLLCFYLPGLSHEPHSNPAKQDISQYKLSFCSDDFVLRWDLGGFF